MARSTGTCHLTDFDRDLFAKLKRGRGTMQTGQYRRFAACDTSIATV